MHIHSHLCIVLARGVLILGVSSRHVPYIDVLLHTLVDIGLSDSLHPCVMLHTCVTRNARDPVRKSPMHDGKETYE